jgi:hypothetical protein
MNFDGHKLKNGFKAVASSNQSLTRHQFHPKKMMFPVGYTNELNGLPLDDYRNALVYYG